MRWGIAHAGITVDGRFRSCSELVAEYHYNAGRRQTLTTLVRSLRWHAGRLRTKGRQWTSDDLNVQADKLAKEIVMLEKQVEEYYAWELKED
jgi:hypothetical protein